MTITAQGHWQGDATKRCERLRYLAKSPQDFERLALLLRVSTDPEQFERLIQAAESIEAEALAAADPVLS